MTPDKTKLSDRDLLIELCQATEGIRRDLMKIVFVLIAVVAAKLGLKLFSIQPTSLASHATVVIPGPANLSSVFEYLVTFSAVFVILATLHDWRLLTLSNKLLKLVFSFFLLFSAYGKLVLFQPGRTVSPVWFNPAINILLITIAFLLVWGTVKGKIE